MEIQNKYFGDLHDFYKYYFIKNVSHHYPVGIHWCLVPDDNSDDGKKKLSDKEKNIDNELFMLLNNNGNKNISIIEKYFPRETKYYKTLLDKYYYEHIYYKESLEKLSSQEIIFFDPDNGIEMPSTNNKNKFKYVSYRLLFDFWKKDKSLIIYQHSDRTKTSLHKKINNLCEVLKCKNYDIIILKRAEVKYICIVNKKHAILRDIFAEIYSVHNEYEYIEI